MDEIHHKKKLDIDESLIEIGGKTNITDGLSKDEENKIYDSITINLPKDKLFNGIKTFRQLEKKLEETVNPYDRIKLYNIWNEIEKEDLKIKPNTSQVKNNYKKFLNNLKKSNDETILVISHGGCIGVVQRMICNINSNNIDIKIISKYYDTNNLFGNCSICCLGLENNNFSLVSPANTNHLLQKAYFEKN